jgi:hypothetical protein
MNTLELDAASSNLNRSRKLGGLADAMLEVAAEVLQRGPGSAEQGDLEQAHRAFDLVAVATAEAEQLSKRVDRLADRAQAELDRARLSSEELG